MGKPVKKLFITGLDSRAAWYSVIWHEVFLSCFTRCYSVYDADVVLLQRAHSITEYTQPVIYFIDDLLWCFARGYKQFPAEIMTQATYWLSHADIIIASTSYLATWLHLKFRIEARYLPVALPDRYYCRDIVTKNRTRVVLTTGFNAHDHDITDSGLLSCWETLQNGLQVQVLGRSKVLGTNNIVTYSQYLNTLRQARIGLIPLQDHPFNYAKTILKFLEYVVSGVVPVFSRIRAGDYAKLADMFPDLVVEDGDWLTAINRVWPRTEKIWPEIFQYCYDNHRHSVTYKIWNKLMEEVNG